MVRQLYEHYLLHVELLPKEYLTMMEQRDEQVEQIVCDYVAGMTDNYAIRKYSECFIPNVWK